ncbi:hypothetical protein QEJ31_15260 [Pigmentibacter sp. JX0631]|uniref:tetratricopeptide repeat protein n=1 Tax=Pigmentibacter sp. JX0631 TaxID=2976982 RepID=UPI00246837E0|nr:hypothetical protein [Pigmentibacter sp. JX0631]WGL59889.1 hypothetical protein QEJ31_15260 [Pigmentibacter sp. JX0631]
MLGKKIRFLYILGILQLLLTAKFVIAQEWPTLFLPEDIIPENKNDLKKIEKMTAKTFEKMSSDDVRNKIYQSFYFIADFLSSTKGELPKGWFESKKDPEKSLIHGFPPELKRPPLQIFFPAYNLNVIGYFFSDDKYISRLNVCQGFWLEERLQKAYDCMFFLQMDLAKDNVPINSLTRIQVNILHGFLFLYLATNEVKDVHIWNAKTIPPSPQEFTEGDHYAMARAIFAYVANQIDDSLYLPKEKTKVIENVYKHAFENPVFFKVSTKISSKKTTVTFIPEHLDPLLWIQTVMPIVYANTMAMNQGILLWQRAFNSALKLEKYFDYFVYPKMPEGSPIEIFDRPLVTREIYISPKNNTDFLVASDLFRTSAMLKAKDPGKALEYIAAGILKKGHPEISSLLFTLSANAYFDLDLLRWARRSYSWAELISKPFALKVPSSLFYGAETAYWLGYYDIAKKGFERFTSLIGDPEYGPWAYLRLAEIAERQGESDKAKNKYEMLLRKFNKHPVSADAQVRLFCLYENSLSKRARMVEYAKVQEKIKDARDLLKKQAKACLLKVDLDNLQADAEIDSKNNVVEKSLKQKKAIDNYAKEFPDSEFLGLFNSRLKELELSVGTFLATENACFELLDYFKKNKEAIQSLEKNNHHYVKGLKWEKEEKLKVLRCSAFVKDFPIWNEMRKSEVGSDGDPLHSEFYRMMFNPSVDNALRAYDSLKKSNESWKEDLAKVERAQFDFILNKEFWSLLTLRELIKFDLLSSKSSNNLLSTAVSQDLFKEPKQIFSSTTFCAWMLRSSPSFNKEKWLQILDLKASKEWIILLSDKKNEKNLPCEKGFAKAIFTYFLKNPDSTFDEKILYPYLQNKGLADASEEWLQYVQRIEKNRGKQDKEVIEIYRKLRKEAKVPLVKDAADLWFKKNMPDEADKLLW